MYYTREGRAFPMKLQHLFGASSAQSQVKFICTSKSFINVFIISMMISERGENSNGNYIGEFTKTCRTEQNSDLLGSSPLCRHMLAIVQFQNNTSPRVRAREEGRIKIAYNWSI